MTRDEILSTLQALLPAQLEILIEKLGVSSTLLASPHSAQALRAVDLLRLIEQQRRLTELGEHLAALVSPVPPAPRGAPEVSIGRLPHTGADLFGREEELAWLDRCWENGARVVSIVAWGGVGKSALVNGWVRRMDADGWRGAERVFAWSFYSQGTTDRVVSADEFVSEALIAFGDKDPTAGSPWSKGERLARLVKKQRVLLILDGMEPLQWGPGPEEGKIKDPSVEALIRELGAQNKGMCLITSRIQVRDLDDLLRDKNPRLDLDHLSTEAGVEVLRARGAKGDEVEMRAAVEGYRGHSLTLTLLGSYLRSAYKGDIHRWRDVGPRGMEHTRRIMMAYERWFLGKPELAILRLLGLFDRPAGEGEIDALRAPPSIDGLTGELDGIDGARWNEALTALRDVGLLAACGEDGAAALDAHPLTREHFGEALRRDRPEAFREGHRRLYGHFERIAEDLPETLDGMLPLYRAVRHGCLAGRWGAAFDILFRRIRRGEDHWSLKRLGAVSLDLAAFASVAEAPPLGETLAPDQRHWIENSAGVLCRAVGRIEDSRRYLRQAVKIATAQGELALASTSARNLASTERAAGNLTMALEAVDEAIRFADATGEHRLDKQATRAQLLHDLGRLDESRAAFETIERAVKEGDDRHPPRPYYLGGGFGSVLLDLGEVEAAHERARWSLDHAREHASDPELGSPLNLGLLERTFARTLAALGRTEEAARYFDEAVHHVRLAGRHDHLASCLTQRAALSSRTSPDLARRDLDEALTLSTRCGFRLHEADTHLAYARLYLQTSALPEARHHLTKARAIIQATGYHRRDAQLTELEATCPAG